METLVAFVIVGVSITLLQSGLMMVKNFNFDFYVGEDEVSIRQMRLLYILSSTHQIENNELVITYFGDELRFRKYNDNMILSPGYQVFFQKIDTYDFEEIGDCIYVKYRHIDEKEKKQIIGC
ncbi:MULTISPECIES: hypothetical protein [unclassified Breznakia]|uniref:hypothetical protein n=1 Tax=unclassified Breznakia TaxID=2623764 RepID=UPI002405E9C6|nr:MULTISPECIES: hypothetical protein [unclassified Breznakia]